MKLIIVADTDIAQAMREVQGKGEREVMRRAVELAEQRETLDTSRSRTCKSKSNDGTPAR